MVSEDGKTLEVLIAELLAVRGREEELVLAIAALLEAQPRRVPENVQKVFAQAKDAIGEDAARFLVTPHKKLNGEMPVSVARDVEGATKVEDLIAHIVYGVY